MPNNDYLMMGGIKYVLQADGSQVLAEIAEVDKKLARQRQGINGFLNSVQKGFQSLGQFISNSYMNIRMAITDVVSTMSRFTNAALEQRRALQGLQVMAGQEFGKVKKYVQDLAADGQVSLTALSTSFKNLISSGYSADNAAELLKLSKAFAMFNRQAGLSMDEAIQRMTEGIKNENSVLTDSAGITKNLSVIYKEYADRHGKAVASLTQTEKAEAFLLQTRTEAVKFMPAYEAALQSEEGVLGSSQAKINQFTAAIGDKLLPAQVKLLEIVNAVIDRFMGLPAPVQTLIVSVTGIAAAFVLIAPAVSALIPILTTQLIPTIAAVAAGTAGLATTVAVATGGLAMLAGVLVPLGVSLAGTAAKLKKANDYVNEFDDKLKNSKGADEYRQRLEDLIKAFNKLDKKEQDLVIRNFENRIKAQRTVFEQYSQSIGNMKTLAEYEAWKKRKDDYDNRPNFSSITMPSDIAKYSTEEQEKFNKALEERTKLFRLEQDYAEFLAGIKPVTLDVIVSPGYAKNTPSAIILKWLESLGKAEAIEMGLKLKVINPEQAKAQIDALLNTSEYSLESLTKSYERLKTPGTYTDNEAGQAAKKLDEDRIATWRKLLDLKRELTDEEERLRASMAEVNKNYQELVKATEKMKNEGGLTFGQALGNEITTGFAGLSGSIAGLIAGYDALRESSARLKAGTLNLAGAMYALAEAKKAFEDDPGNESLKMKYEEAAEKARELTEILNDARKDSDAALQELAGGWVTVAESVADFSIAFWDAMEQASLAGASVGGAVEEGMEGAVQSLAEEVPVIGKILSKLIDGLWQTQEERRRQFMDALDDQLAEYNHRMNMGEGGSSSEQLAFWERRLILLKDSNADQQDVWAAEEKIYQLKQKQVDEQRELNKLLKEQKDMLEEAKKTASEKELDQRAREFERMVSSGQINLGITEDRKRAIAFYQSLADKAGQLGATDAREEYLDKIAQLQGGLGDTRNTESAMSGQTADAVTALEQSLGLIENSIQSDPGVVNANQTISLTEQLTRLRLEGEDYKKTKLDGSGGLISILSRYAQETLSWYNKSSGADLGAKIFDKNQAMANLQNLKLYMRGWKNILDTYYKNKYPGNAQASLFGGTSNVWWRYVNGSIIPDDTLLFSTINMAPLTSLSISDSDHGIHLEGIRKKIRDIGGADAASFITFHTGGIVGTDLDFNDVLSRLIKPDEAIIRARQGELVVPADVTAQILSGGRAGNPAAGDLNLNINQFVVNTQAKTTDQTARDTVFAIEKYLNKNGYSILKK